MADVNFDIDLLRCFLTVAETGSFTVAGAMVGRTQSAVSQRMKRLEDLVGGRLLNRAGGAVSMTARGELIAATVRKMIALNDEIAEKVASLNSQEQAIDKMHTAIGNMSHRGGPPDHRY